MHLCIPSCQVLGHHQLLPTCASYIQPTNLCARHQPICLLHTQWDVARIAWQSPGPKKWLSLGMPPAWLNSYHQNLTSLVALVRKQVPKVGG
jgi:hypothetical protein